MKRHLSLILPAAVAGILIVLASVFEGLWTQRWDDTPTAELKAFADVLNDKKCVPEEIGGVWEALKTAEMNPREREAAGAIGDLSRTYRNLHTQEVVSVYIICGVSTNEC